MKKLLMAASLAFSSLVIASAATITNGSFEQPATSNFTYNPVDPTLAWTFLGRSGVASSTFFAGPAPDGTQVAFIQQFLDQSGSNLSSVSQSLTGVLLAPSSLSFSIAQRPGTSANPIVVTYGAQNLGTFTPVSTAFSVVTINFTPGTTSGALVFKSAALTTGDLNSAVDNVSFANSTGVPEPATLALLGPALGGLLYFRRRRS